MTKSIKETKPRLQSPEKKLKNIFELRTREIAGVLEYLFKTGKLNKENLAGKVIDIGTGAGAGILALKMFGAKNVIGVDHITYHNGVNVKNLLGDKFIESSVERYLASLSPSSVRLVTAFNANILLSDFFPEVVRVLAPNGQILVTTNAPESVSYLGHGVWLDIETDWQELPIDKIPIAEREAFLKGKLSFILATHYPDRDKFFFIETKRGTK